MSNTGWDFNWANLISYYWYELGKKNQCQEFLASAVKKLKKNHKSIDHNLKFCAKYQKPFSGINISNNLSWLTVNRIEKK